MKINDRLKKIGDLVQTNSFCLDVGCDHAFLDIYLVQRKDHIKAIASDIKEGPLHQARENIKKYHLEDEIECRLGNGLDTYSDDKGNPISNAVVEIASDEGFKNIITTYKLDTNGAYKALGLSEGIYYARLKRPLKDDFELSIIDTETGNTIINIPTEEDYVPLEELPESYSELRKHYIAKGMIYLPEIKYGHTLLVRETKAPSGYYFDNADVYITPQAPYGINIMDP